MEAALPPKTGLSTVQTGFTRARSGSVVSGGNDTITLQINPANISSDNINELNGKLIPVSDTGLDPARAGLKGDFYHVPDTASYLTNLDTALANTNKKFVCSDIFSTIEFYQAGGNATNALTEDESFKSGVKSVPVRRDFVAVFMGFINITTPGSYVFKVYSDDGFRLKVNNTTVTEYIAGRGTAASTGNITLNPGIYPIELTYFQGTGQKSLTLEWTPPEVTTEVVPYHVLYNGLNILAKMAPKKPTITSTTTLGSNSKVNVAVNQSTSFTVTSTPGSTNVTVTGYRWQQVSGSTSAGTGFDNTTSAEKNYSFSEPGDYTVYCKSVDQKGVESTLISIPVRAWNPPTVRDTPPQSAVTAGTVSWSSGKYVGVVGQAINLMADGALGSNNPTGETLQKFIWDFNNDWNTIELTQEPATSPKLYIWSAATPSASVRCRAVNNFGIQGADRLFTVTAYSPVTANTGGPYNGRPNRAVNLAGSINQSSYLGATFQYQWQVYANSAWTDITTSSDGKAQYTWTTEGDYQVKFNATVTTSEGLTLNGSATATVSVAAGMPTAMPGGAYHGGIAGGNFSPIQVQGNPPDFIEAEDIGHIVDCTWTFDHGTEPDNSNEYRTLLAENVDSMISILTNSTYGATAEKATNNVFSGSASLAIKCVGDSGNSRYRAPVPGWSYSIVENPQTANEFRYITFAWRKEGGARIALRLWGVPAASTTSVWYHYYAGFSSYWGPPSVQVSTTISGQWEIVTRDVFADFGAFTLTGMGFAPIDGTADGVGIGYFDSIYLHKSPTLSLVSKGSPAATQTYSKAGTYTVSLKVKSEFGKWGLVSTTSVQVIDGKITGYVRAVDSRTPVKDVQLTLTSSHVDKNVLAAIAADNPTTLRVTNDGSGIYTLTDSKGYYAFEHIPLGSYRIAASKIDANNTIHKFETRVKATELTLDAPNQLAIDFVDLSVFPISGRIVYSIKKNNMDVMVKDVTIEAQTVGSTNSIKSLPSKSSGDATGSNYSLPLFNGQYLFLATLQGHDIRLKDGTPNYDSTTGLITIDRTRTDIDFIDYTAYTLTVFVKDSGGYSMSNKDVAISGDNGQATGKTDESGNLVATLPPGKYTVTVPGAQPETSEVDLTGNDQVVNMTIPVKIVVSFSPRPKLFDVPADFITLFGLTPNQNPEGYMYYYPPEPRNHVYVITATANGKPVVDFKLFVTDEVSMLTENAPEEQEIQVQGNEERYTVTAGLPKQDRNHSPPLAAPKRISFRNEWQLHTEEIETYDILERTNQYVYTIRDIENLIQNLETAIEKTTDDNEKTQLTNAKTTCQDLLDENLAYVWERDYFSQGKSFEDFKSDNGLPDESENLIFSAGPTFEYSRTIYEGINTNVSIAVSVEATAEVTNEMDVSTGFKLAGSGVTFDLKSGGGAINQSTEYGAEWESGKEAEQSVGFVLKDDDIGDNISTRVYADPVWGTPIFFQDAGSITSDRWEPGTNKGIDVTLELVEQPTNSGPFDYNDGAHYKVKVDYLGLRDLDTFLFDFSLLAPPTLNKENAYVEFNGYWGAVFYRAFNREKLCCCWGINIPTKERPGEYGRERV